MNAGAPTTDRVARYPGMSYPRMCFYLLCKHTLIGIFKFVYRIHFLHAHRVPRTGGVLLVSNHQSYFDPAAIGVGLPHRSCSFLARDSLFRFPPFGWLIRALGASPINRDETDTGAMRRTIELLKQGHAILVFPEGTRTPDGTIKPFKRGVALLIKRAGVPVIPVAIEGAWNSWPRGDRPHLTDRRIAIAYGDPIDPKTLVANGPGEALELLALDIDALRLEARAIMWNKTNGRYPPPGFGDDTIDINAWRAAMQRYADKPGPDV